MNHSSKKQILIISFSDLENDPRVYRQIKWLSQDYHLTTAGYTPSGLPVGQHISLTTSSKTQSKIIQFIRRNILSALLLIGRQYEKFYWSRSRIKIALKELKSLSHEPDIIIANDIDTMPLVYALFPKAKIVLDLHEYAPKEWEDRLYWRLLVGPYKKYLCKKYIPQAGALITVCEGIADEFNKLIGRKPVVITNAREFFDLQPSETSSGCIRMIYHGAAFPSRRTENCIKLMDYLDDRFELDVILIPGNQNYIDKIRAMGRKNPRIRFIQKFPMRQIPEKINGYDVGLYLIPPTNYNNEICLPNKFFEFVQARLAIAIGPSVEMAREVRKYGCGVVAQDFTPESLAKELNKLTLQELRSMKQQTHIAAKTLNAETNKCLFIESIGKCL